MRGGQTLTEGKKGQEKVLSLVCGIFLLATALEPLDMLQMPSFADGTGQIEAQAQQVVDEAQAEASAQMAAIITQQTSHIFWTKPIHWGCVWRWGWNSTKRWCPGV